jgi:hypothetical protein
MNDFSIFKDGWVGEDTVCGWGSRLEHAQWVLADMPHVFDKMGVLYSLNRPVPIVNDAGCGDLWWIRNMGTWGWDYMGYDLFPRPCWDELSLKTQQLDLCEEVMRPCDLIICRDVFIHWPTEYVLKALDLFKQSGKYLYSTSYTGEFFEFNNDDRITVFDMHHSKLNLCSPPFNLGKPIHVTKEDYEDGYSRKVMCLWKLK